jgi:predicted Zn-dependent peptidase
MGVRVDRLANGLAVMSRAMPHVRTAAVALAVDAGARHEAEADHGIAHLFEHMLFKGTGRRSARALAEEIEDVGGALNAWTSRDQTMFHGRIMAADLPLAVDLIADMLTDARFDSEELAREKTVVLSEIGEAFDTPDDLVFDLCHAVAFAGQPLGRPVLGTAHSVDAMPADALHRWRDGQYRGGALVLAAAGAVDHDRLLADAERLFGGLPGPVMRRDASAGWIGGTLAEPRRTEQTQLVMGFAGPGSRDPGHAAAVAFATALGGGMSSRLFQALREERGLAYSVSAAHGAHTDVGMMSLHCAARPGDAESAGLLALEVARAIAADLDQAELDRARAQLKAGLLMGLEGCAGEADWLARGWLTFGRVDAAEEAVAELDLLTVEAVRAAGVAMLASRPAIAAVGPRADRLADRLSLA